MVNVNIKINEFYGDDTITLKFPDKWDVEKINMVGHNEPPLTDKQIRDAFEHPIGSLPIEQLARGKRGRIVVTCDDLHRPTPAHNVFPFIMEQLKKAGISDNQILIIAAVGSHEPLSLDQFVRKVGLEMVQKYECINHNCFENLQYLGLTTHGNKLLINKEFMEADLRISVGGIKRHTPGSGGGGKSIVPGISGIQTIREMHGLLWKTGEQWNLKTNDLRKDIQESARMSGLDITVNCNYNDKRELIGVHVGDVDDAWIEAVKLGYKMHSTPALNKNVDMVVICTYPQSRLGSAPDPWPARRFLREGGTVVAVHQHPLGCWHHYWSPARNLYLSRKKGIFNRREMVEKAGNVIVFNKMQAWKTIMRFSERTEFIGNWEDILKRLQEIHGDYATVAVYPATKLQFDPEEKSLII